MTNYNTGTLVPRNLWSIMNEVMYFAAEEEALVVPILGGIGAGVVPLPAAPRRDFPPPGITIPPWMANADREMPCRYDQYPEELRADFVDVSDGPAAIERLQRRLVDIVRKDQKLRDQVHQALDIRR